MLDSSSTFPYSEICNLYKNHDFRYELDLLRWWLNKVVKECVGKITISNKNIKFQFTTILYIKNHAKLKHHDFKNTILLQNWTSLSLIQIRTNSNITQIDLISKSNKLNLNRVKYGPTRGMSEQSAQRSKEPISNSTRYRHAAHGNQINKPMSAMSNYQ